MAQVGPQVANAPVRVGVKRSPATPDTPDIQAKIDEAIVAASDGRDRWVIQTSALEVEILTTEQLDRLGLADIRMVYAYVYPIPSSLFSLEYK